MITDPTPSETYFSAKVVHLLSNIIDPELGINIVDMGLIYSIVVDNQISRVTVGMTLSSKGCPMGKAILAGVENLLIDSFPGFIIEVNLIWEPAWSPKCLSKDAREWLE